MSLGGGVLNYFTCSSELIFLHTLGCNLFLSYQLNFSVPLLHKYQTTTS